MIALRMPGTTPTAYDAVRYPGAAFAQTHPDRLATIASLYGLKPAPAERCRVLELGCGRGANLVPMAYVLRGSTFLGLDLAGSAIEEGRRAIAALGLGNVTLVHADLLGAKDLGTFDYVIAHGLYSWVPGPVQERILAIASEVLAPGGVAYVSYNALPGCHVRNAVRQMMRWHVRGLENPAEKVEQARGLLRFLGDAAPARPLFSAILNDALDHLKKQADAVLFHDDLADFNEPLLFADFVERAARHGLAFLSEADYCDMSVWNPESPAGRFLLEVGAENVVVQQQYRDFLVFRRFRQTLLTRGDAPRAVEADAEALRGLFVAAGTRPQSPGADLASDEPMGFGLRRDGEIKTPHPLSKAAFLELGEAWPRWIPVPDLLAAARARVLAAGGLPATAEDETRLLRFLLAAYGGDVIEVRSVACPFVTTVSDRPRASALARHQARTSDTVTNLRHEEIRLEDPAVKTFLQLLDGTRDRAAIAREMASALRSAGPAAAAGDLDRGLALNFDRVAGLALLEA